MSETKRGSESKRVSEKERESERKVVRWEKGKLRESGDKQKG